MDGTAAGPAALRRIVLELGGELDASITMPDIETLAPLLASGLPVVVDLGGVSFCDIAGADALVAFLAGLGRHGTVTARGAAWPGCDLLWTVVPELAEWHRPSGGRSGGLLARD